MFSIRMRRFLGISLSTLLFVSTSGVPVHKVICLCQGQETVSLIIEDNTPCCRHEAASAASSCCSDPTASCVIPEGDQTSKCQDAEITLARIAGQFLTSLPMGDGEQLTAVLSAGFSGFRDAGQYPYAIESIPPHHLQLHLSDIPIFRRGCQIRC